MESSRCLLRDTGGSTGDVVADIAYLGPNNYTEDQLIARLEQETPTLISVDTETVSLKDRRMIGFGIGLNEREAVYFPTWHTSKYLALAWRLLASPCVKAFHNAPYDLHALDNYLTREELDVPDGDGFIGPVYYGSREHPLLADSSLMGRVQGLPVGSLQDMARAYLSMIIAAISDILPARQNMLDLSTETVAHKCMRDCLATIRLHSKLGGGAWWEPDGHTWSYEPNLVEGYDPTEPTSYYVSPQMKDCYQVDIRIIPLLMRMSMRGLALRPNRVGNWYEKYSKEKLFYEDICDKEFFNPSSPQQVGFILAQRGNWLPFTRSKKQLKTDDEVLSELSDPLAGVVLKYREVAKLLSTYLRKWLGEDRAYTHFRLDLSTSRLASYDDNMQNIPKPIRDVFAPDSGAWSWADYSEIEMRMIAYASQDPVMMKVYEEGGSVHADTQLTLWPDSNPDNSTVRRKAKDFNFAMSFNAKIKTLAEHSKLPISVCTDCREVWIVRYKVAYNWIQRQIEEGPSRGYAETLDGRRCKLPELGTAPYEHIEKCAINYIPQGSAAGVVKRAMLKCDKLGMDQALQVHDEILVDGVVEFPEDLAHVLPGIHTPFKASVSPIWGS